MAPQTLCVTFLTNSQAVDRAVRIGQKRVVHVYRFVTLGTVRRRRRRAGRRHGERASG
jgi:hypothetical protein